MIPHRDTFLNIANDIDKFNASGTSERLKAVARNYNIERRKVCNVLFTAKQELYGRKELNRRLKDLLISAYKNLRCDD